MQQVFTKDNFFRVLRSLTSSNDLFIAYSGGLDSHVLLHVLAMLRTVHPELQLTAIHVNHSLSKNALLWEEHCKTQCLKLDVPLLFVNVNARIKINQHSPEEIARKLRYEAFAEILPKGACLLTAHQANDQAETLLLQLFRGAGVKGLSAMPSITSFAQGFLLRPLLPYTRNQLQAYATLQHLSWIEDESNFDTQYDRNFLRHNLLPQITQHWSGIVTALNRVAMHSAETSYLLDEIGASDLLTVGEGETNFLSISKLLALHEYNQRNLLRYWIEKRNFPTPSATKLQQIEQTVLRSRSDAMPQVTWHGAEVRRYQDKLYVMTPISPHDNTIQLPWDLSSSLLLPSNIGTLTATIINFNPTINRDKFSVRFRCGGETIVPEKRKHHHALAKLMQEWQVPPWQRDRIPLVYYADELIAVVGLCYRAGWEQMLKLSLQGAVNNDTTVS